MKTIQRSAEFEMILDKMKKKGERDRRMAHQIFFQDSDQREISLWGKKYILFNPLKNQEEIISFQTLIERAESLKAAREKNKNARNFFFGFRSTDTPKYFKNFSFIFINSKNKKRKIISRYLGMSDGTIVSCLEFLDNTKFSFGNIIVATK